jgi:hypothetical protein
VVAADAGSCRLEAVLLKQEFLAIMLGVRRRTVPTRDGTLQDAGLIASRYGCIFAVWDYNERSVSDWTAGDA